MNSGYIQIVLDIIILIVGFYIAFVKSYFNEKGKNLATQQDVEKITTLIEQAKKQFNEDLEYLKNRLSLYNQNFVSIKTLERNALIDINTKYSEWLNSLSTFALAYYSYDNYESLKSMDLFFAEKHLAFNVAEDHLHLFVHDQELMNKKTKLIELTFKLHESVLTHITKFMLNCVNYNDQWILPIDEYQLKLNREYHERQNPIIKDSVDESIKIQLEINLVRIDFTKILNYKIYELIEN